MKQKKGRNAADMVRDFYDGYGWVKKGEESGEDKSFRNFGRFHKEFYRDVTGRRELAQFADLHGQLLIAGGGDLPQSHLNIAQQFEEVYCLDFSKRALDISKEKLGEDANYVHASILDMPLPSNSVDAAFCSHVIYHIDGAQQTDAVRQLIRVVRPGGRVVITYQNPRAPQYLLDRTISYAMWPWRKFRRSLQRKKGIAAETRPALYFKAYPLRYWNQFKDSCDVRKMPWQVFSASQERKYIRSDRAAEKFYRWVAKFEENHSSIATRFWSYPMIVLTKRH